MARPFVLLQCAAVVFQKAYIDMM